MPLELELHALHPVTRSLEFEFSQDPLPQHPAPQMLELQGCVSLKRPQNQTPERSKVNLGFCLYDCYVTLLRLLHPLSSLPSILPASLELLTS